MHALVLATLGAAQRRGCAQHFPKSALPFFRPKVCTSPASGQGDCVEGQVRKRQVGFRPLIQALLSVAKVPDERWATDQCRDWAGHDGWASLALVIDCFSRELLGWHLSRSGRTKTAEAALEQALIARYGCLGKVKQPYLLDRIPV